MRRTLAWGLMLLLLFSAWGALASQAQTGETYMGDMYVANCREWVSLRREMSTSSEVLAQVPLGAHLEDVVFCPGEFALCNYNGLEGYILTRYLSSVNPEDVMAVRVQRGLAGYQLASGEADVELLEYGADSILREPERSYPAANLFDRNADSAWSEGVPGDGIGESLWAAWSAREGSRTAVGVALRIGYQKEEWIYQNNGRPRGVTIEIGGRRCSAVLLDLEDGWQSILFEEPLSFEDRIDFRLIIDSVYAGTQHSDTCITELDLLLE